MLTLQEKLALSLTSHGSKAALARSIGVSSRTIVRWLNEGYDTGVKSIPKYAKRAINNTFAIHKDLSKSQAAADEIPFSAARPVFIQRKPLNSGLPGLRAVAERTEYIRSELRQEIMIDQQLTKKYIAASVRSVIDLKHYFEEIAEEEIERKSRRGITKKRLGKILLDKFAAKELYERGRIVDKVQPFAIFTRYANIGPMMGDSDFRGVEDIETQLRQKHEPAASVSGTASADQYLFQVKREYKTPVRVSKKSARKSGGNKG